MLNKNALIYAMLEAGYTQVKLAEALNVSKNTLNNKINGRGSFTIAQVDKICDVLKISDNKQKTAIFLSNSSQKREI